MEDLKAVARMTRWALKDTLYQLDFIPDDKLDWKPNGLFKSALDIIAEVVFVARSGQGIFEGRDMDAVPIEKPATREEAKRMLSEAIGAYLDGLENAGPEIDRPVNTPVGQLAGAKTAIYMAIELIHHHGQITMLQALAGDPENHRSEEAMQEFAVDAGSAQ